MFYVYVLQSEKDSGLYIGYSSDLRRRYSQHQAGESLSTKGRLPWLLIYYEAYLLEDDAKGRELFLKSGAGREFLKKQLKNYFNVKPQR